MSEAVYVRKTVTSPAESQNRKEKRLQIIYAHMLCVLNCVSLAGKAKNERKGSCLWKSKWKRASYWKSRVYIVKPCHVVSSKHTVYFARDKSADVGATINHVTSLTNWFPKLISLPKSTIFVSEASESVSNFLEFSYITAILKKV